MLKPIAAALALLSALPGTTIAADALALRVVGFSPDGRNFAFMQYGPRWEAEQLYAEVFVIDAERDRYVQGVPVRVTGKMKDDSTEDNIAPQLKAFLATAQTRAASALGASKISKPGAALANIASAKAGEHSSGSKMPKEAQGAAAVTAKHPMLGELSLKLETKTMDWPKTSRHGNHKGALGCGEAMDPEKGAALRLTLEQGGRSMVLQDDKTIPASRNCVQAYGIVEVQTFDRPDGKVTLAVILGKLSRGFEGADRSFLAVTQVLER